MNDQDVSNGNKGMRPFTIYIIDTSTESGRAKRPIPPSDFKNERSKYLYSLQVSSTVWFLELESSYDINLPLVRAIPINGAAQKQNIVPASFCVLLYCLHYPRLQVNLERKGMYRCMQSDN